VKVGIVPPFPPGIKISISDKMLTLSALALPLVAFAVTDLIIELGAGR